MRKSRLSLLVVATVIAIILVAGCTSPTQTSPQVVSSNNSSTTASTTTTSSSSAIKASISPSPSASATPTAAASPTQAATPTASPSASGKIATSITGNSAFNINPNISRSLPVSWGFEVVPTGVAQILSVPVTVKIDNKAIGTVTPVGGSETVSFSLTGAQTNGLTAGQHTLTVSFAGDSTYQPSVLTQKITVT